MEDVLMTRFALIAALLLSACMPQEQPTGAEDFAAYCAACHGLSGKGNGEMAATLDKKPADLTGLASRNDGEFPTTRVMAKIWGYSGGHNGTTVMPNFGPLLQSDLVPYDGGDGIQTPTPLRLVQIAEYLKTIQG
jgi:mono/diheme cytochrome c family protein